MAIGQTFSRNYKNAAIGLLLRLFRPRFWNAVIDRFFGSEAAKKKKKIQLKSSISSKDVKIKSEEFFFRSNFKS